MGGKGGKGANNGKMVKTKTLFLFIGTLNIEDKQESGKKIENAANGRNGVSKQNLHHPREPNTFDNQLQIINRYKNYVHENMVNHLQESKLKAFISGLDENSRVQSKYSSLGFLNELLEMESQYSKLQNKLSFKPFVTSLRMRMDAYVSKHRNNVSIEDKQLLYHLQAATLSKLYSIQTMSKYISSIDPTETLCLAQEHIYDQNGSNTIDIIMEHRKKLAMSNNRKAFCIEQIIEKQIIPTIARALLEVNEQIQMQKPTDDTFDERILNELLIEQRILFWLKDTALPAVIIAVSGIVSASYSTSVLGK